MLPSRVAQGAGPLGAERAGQQPGAEAGDAEPRPLLLREHGHPEWTRGYETAGAEQVDRRERGDHAERTVVRTAVGDGVEVATGHDAAGQRPAEGRHHATVLPLPSRSSVKSRLTASSWNQSSQARPTGDQANRW